MPTYEYACETCGSFEHYQSITESALQRCPRCDGPVCRRIPRQLTVIFRGPGFHVNDYRRGSSPPTEAASGESAAEAAPKPPEGKAASD